MVPDRLLETFTAEESFYQCEEEPIRIIPTQGMEEIKFSGWKVPRLRALVETSVPLWVALLLKKQGRCKIKFPTWLEEKSLRQSVEDERQKAEFSKLPFSWQPTARVLLDEASDDLDGDIDVVRGHIKDLTELRQVKIRSGVTQSLNETQLSMDGLGILELNEVRPVLARTMLALHKLQI